MTRSNVYPIDEAYRIRAGQMAEPARMAVAFTPRDTLWSQMRGTAAKKVRQEEAASAKTEIFRLLVRVAAIEGTAAAVAFAETMIRQMRPARGND